MPELSNQSMPHEVMRFYQDYVNAFDSLDATSIANLYTVPAVVSDSLGIHTHSTFDALKEKMASYCENFQKAGYHSASYVCETFRALGSDACFVDLEWSVSLRDDLLVYKTGYLLYRTDGLWRVSHATVY